MTEITFEFKQVLEEYIRRINNENNINPFLIPSEINKIEVKEDGE